MAESAPRYSWQFDNGMERWGPNKAPYALVGPVRCVAATDKAIQVKWEGAHVWLPKSMLHPTENEIRKPGDEGMLIIPEWLAKLKGWL